MSGAPNRRRLLAGGGLALLATHRPTAAASSPFRLRRGINAWPWFGLTREYPAPRTDYAWPPFETGRPVPRASDLARLHAAGFDFVRIPVDAGPFLSFSGARADALFEEIDAAVRAVHEAGLAAIVNLAINTATHYYTSARLLGGAGTPGFAAYRELVAKIAARLRRVDPARTLFEPVNEPPQSCTDALWPAMQIELLAAARAAAADLPLVATGACGGMAAGLVALDPAPLRRFAPLLFTFHFYEPYVFSHQGAPWMAGAEPMYGVLNAVPWPASAGTRDATQAAVRRRALAVAGTPAALRDAQRAVDDYFDGAPGPAYLAPFFDQVAAWGRRHEIASADILLGEFGALRSDARYVAAGAADRARYVRDVRETAEQHGFPWAFWNLFDGMGMVDEATRALDTAIAAALGLRVTP